MTDQTSYTIDAAGKRLGRIASAAAHALMGKRSPHFVKHRVADVEVRVVNAKQLDISEQKRSTNVHKRYSGYPGGQKTETWGNVIARKSIGAVVTHAVKRMLPNNKLRDSRLRRLKIED